MAARLPGCSSDWRSRRSEIESSRKRADRALWIVFAVCVAIAAVTLIATQLAGPALPTPGPGRLRRVPRPQTLRDLLQLMGIGSLTWYACLVSAPLFIWLSRKLPLERARWQTSLATHVALIIVLVMLTAWLQYELSYPNDARLAPGLGVYIRAALLTNMLPFIAVAAAAQALEARTRARDRELEAARMKGQLAEARLAALSAQLQPHFLFNTLQAISTLIPRDPIAADRVLASLSDLLRELLRHGEQEVPLEEELRVLEPYLDISRTRFGNRLSITIHADQEARRALVPFFVLQPLVENALHHGVGSRVGAGSVHIDAARVGDRLWLSVTDDGPGEPGEPGRGVGLANTRERLQELYGSAGTLEYGPRQEGGFDVRIGIPYRMTPPPGRFA
ncbi:MAG: sensor histidine kinase [Longimicrobiales bacterium]